MFYAKDNWTSISHFEESVQDGALVIDIVSTVKPYRRELKSWRTFAEVYKPRFLKEFVEDLKGVQSFDEMGWYFDQKGSFTSKTYLKEQVVEALSSSKGREALKAIGVEKAKQLFPMDELIDGENFVDRIIVNLRKDDTFGSVFY